VHVYFYFVFCNKIIFVLDNVDLAILPVKHTYAHNKYEFSPPKDKFDELFAESTDASTAAAVQVTTSVTPADKGSDKIKGKKSSSMHHWYYFLCFLH